MMKNHTEVFHRIRMLDCLYKRWDESQVAWISFIGTPEEKRARRHMIRCRREYDQRVESPEGLPEEE